MTLLFLARHRSFLSSTIGNYRMGTTSHIHTFTPRKDKTIGTTSHIHTFTPGKDKTITRPNVYMPRNIQIVAQSSPTKEFINTNGQGDGSPIVSSK